MSDQRLRELERRWRETGCFDDEAAWLLELQRTNQIRRSRLEWLSAVGHPAASLALEKGVVPPRRALSNLHMRLAEAVVWSLERTAAREHPAHSLRTPAFLDTSVDDLQRKFEDRPWVAAVDTVASRRRDALERGFWPKEVVGSSLVGGRLLVYEPHSNTADGSPQVASEGFFDVHDAPPWDGWISYTPGADSHEVGTESLGYLLAYVPKALLEQGGFGIELSLIKSIYWAEDCPHQPVRDFLATLDVA